MLLFIVLCCFAVKMLSSLSRISAKFYSIFQGCIGKLTCVIKELEHVRACLICTCICIFFRWFMCMKYVFVMFSFHQLHTTPPRCSWFLPFVVSPIPSPVLLLTSLRLLHWFVCVADSFTCATDSLIPSLRLIHRFFHFVCAADSFTCAAATSLRLFHWFVCVADSFTCSAVSSLRLIHRFVPFVCAADSFTCAAATLTSSVPLIRVCRRFLWLCYWFPHFVCAADSYISPYSD